MRLEASAMREEELERDRRRGGRPRFVDQIAECSLTSKRTSCDGECGHWLREAREIEDGLALEDLRPSAGPTCSNLPP